ncbi:Crp/Fnr family transcriptional regulator [Pedobacter frigiditerrae]|uniref:Crp/Fnr family transcriptional regulator n=1 Tax=Pedobacter frigiditerrae TaxID=2530452 RepID=A0A4R0MNY2_9SPHI|nr:Crp/Fnr family transcriptional regulator [Pedobacter frigiditerrae]TCC88518.1 Crp/Fnr family transcriptional regulator [Pedobacter frigiditerrae]
MFEQINTSVSNYIAFNPEELQIFNQLLKHRTIPKKHFLLRADEVCNFEGFVVKGCLRKYYIDENGQEVIIQFAVENNWISDIASFSNQQPGKLFIETLEESSILYLNPQSKEELLSRVPKFERFYRKLVERNVSLLHNRLHFSISKTAEEKYLDFLENYPSIPQRVAQHHIASYLGMSAEFLSKVRKKLAKRGSHS